MGRLLIATRQQQWSTQMTLASRVLQKLQWKRLSETDLQWQRLMTSFSSEESKWDHCGFVFSEFFLEKQMQLQSYPNSMQWCLGENLSPPYPTCAHYRSQSHQCVTKTGQKKTLPILLALTLWESESAPILCFGWTNYFEGAWGIQEPNLCLRTEVVYQQDPLLQSCRKNLFNKVPFEYAVCMAEAGQTSPKMKNTRDAVSMHSYEWGGTPVLGTGHTASSAQLQQCSP